MACVVLPRSTNAMSARRNISPNAGTFGRLLLRDAGETAAQQLREDEDVELALVVEQEHRGPGRLQVLGAPHVEPHPGERGAQLARRARCPGRRRRGGSRSSAPSATPAPNPPTVPTAAAAVRAISRSPARPRGRKRATGQPFSAALRARPGSGLSARGAPDGREERHVLVAVGVGVARARGRRRAAAERLHGLGLAAPPQRRAAGAPGAMPSSISTGVTSTCSTPIARAAGSTWKRVAEDASTTVCPARRWASTSRQASG